MTDNESTSANVCSSDAQKRKGLPIYTGVLKYFPRALLAISQVSRTGGEQHAPGQPLHWVKGTSTDHLDAMMRHLTDHASGVEVDTDGEMHMAKVAWRALAQLETMLEE